jgi:hypothetical protein
MARAVAAIEVQVGLDVLAMRIEEPDERGSRRIYAK